MTKIGFLACAETLPADKGGKAGERRGDAFEHDLEIAALRPAFAKAGLELIEIDWRAPLAKFEGLALVLLGTAWDYQDHAEAFCKKLDALEQIGVIPYNSPEITRWNADKNYLRALEKAGSTCIPTLWIDDPRTADIADAFAHFDTSRVVVKRQIGAGGMGQHSFSRDTLPDPDWRMGHPAMIQPFLPSIQSEGEYTFVFIDGQFSHGVLKRAGAGDYRIQSLYGGTEEDYTPSPGDLAKAEAVIDALPFGKANRPTDLPAKNAKPLYARIDMVRLENGELALIEAELIEPFLYPLQGPQLGDRLAKAIKLRLS